MGMDEETLKKYKERLLGEEKELEQQIAEHEKPVDFGADVDSGDEEADETEEKANRMAIVSDLRERLNQVKAALLKIGGGKFGVCEKCGGEIETTVLDIDPESRLCSKCKKLEVRK